MKRLRHQITTALGSDVGSMLRIDKHASHITSAQIASHAMSLCLMPLVQQHFRQSAFAKSLSKGAPLMRITHIDRSSVGSVSFTCTSNKDKRFRKGQHDGCRFLTWTPPAVAASLSFSAYSSLPTDPKYAVAPGTCRSHCAALMEFCVAPPATYWTSFFAVKS